MKKVLFILFIINLFMGVTSYAQENTYAQENNSLRISQELDGMGQKVYEGFEYTFSRVSEYVKVTDIISKADMDSVNRVAVLEFSEKAFGENDSILKNYILGNNRGDSTTKNIARTPEQQALMDEILSVIKKFNPKDGLSKLADKLGKINQKAAKTLSETDATVIHIVSITTYYSTKYWLNNGLKWQELGEEVKKKKK
jgi:coenzyme F420-reducing hydrogenase alpha subunit